MSEKALKFAFKDLKTEEKIVFVAGIERDKNVKNYPSLKLHVLVAKENCTKLEHFF